MVLLTIYREVAEGKIKRCSRSYESVYSEVQAGQKSGCFYDIYDITAGRIIDWNEINIREDDSWYYDDADFTWKKAPEDISIEEWMRREFPWLFFDDDDNPSPLPYTVLYYT